ncbi:MAG TPA: hypothetical protein VF524_12200 [Polyangia bacterium]
MEIRQLVQRGFDHHEHERVHDALSDWETALHLEARNVQVGRLVEFARQRVAELEAGQHTSPSRRDTVESPIPQFLAALTERKSDKVAVPAGPLHDGPATKTAVDDRETPKSDWSLLGALGGALRGGQATVRPEPKAPSDTLEDLPVDAADIRASANELLGECRAALNGNRAGPASLAAELALQLAERAPPPGVDDLIEPSLALLERAFRAFMGSPHACPIRAIPTETISNYGLDQRAAFLLSRMDGMTSMADLIDSSGMPHFDAVRVMASLRRAKAIDVLPPLP